MILRSLSGDVLAEGATICEAVASVKLKQNEQLQLLDGEQEVEDLSLFCKDEAVAVKHALTPMQMEMLECWDMLEPHLDYSQYLENRYFVKLLLRRDGFLLELCGRWRDDFVCVAVALETQPLALRFASERLRADRQIVRRAVEKNGAAIVFADTKFRDCAEMARLAVRSVPGSLRHFSKAIRDDEGLSRSVLVSFAELAGSLDRPDLEDFLRERCPSALLCVG